MILFITINNLFSIFFSFQKDISVVSGLLSHLPSRPTSAAAAAAAAGWDCPLVLLVEAVDNLVHLCVRVEGPGQE